MRSKLIVGVNDLATKHPELLKEWDYEKNDKLGIFPNKVRCNSNKKVWWKCSVCGYEWMTVISSRTGGCGCFNCSVKIRVKKFLLPKKGQSLQDKYPNIAKEWNYEKNGDLLPSQVRCFSHKKVWFKCLKCGYEWQSSIDNRVRTRGCQKCAKNEDSKKL